MRGPGTLRSQLSLQLLEPSPPTPLFLGGSGQPPPPLPGSTKGKECPPGHLCFLGSGKTVTPELSSQPGSHTSGRGLTPPWESRRALRTKCPPRGRRWGWVTFKDGDLEAGEAGPGRALLRLTSRRGHPADTSVPFLFVFKTNHCPPSNRCSHDSLQKGPRPPNAEGSLFKKQSWEIWMSACEERDSWTLTSTAYKN